MDDEELDETMAAVRPVSAKPKRPSSKEPCVVCAVLVKKGEPCEHCAANALSKELGARGLSVAGKKWHVLKRAGVELAKYPTRGKTAASKGAPWSKRRRFMPSKVTEQQWAPTWAVLLAKAGATQEQIAGAQLVMNAGLAKAIESTRRLGGRLDKALALIESAKQC